MKQGLKSRGYTIVEVLIVLSVTGFLLVAVMVLISGQQGRTEFTQAVNDIQAQINDVINNVATGYYSYTGNFTCTKGSPPTVASLASSTQGTNQDCVFVGKAMQFGVGGNASAYNIYDIIGNRVTASGKEVKDFTEAQPTVLSGTGIDSTDAKKLLYGLKAVKMFNVNGSGVPIGTVAFTSSFGSYNGCTNLCSGSQVVELHPIANSLLTDDKSTGMGNIKAANFASSPKDGVTICFESGGSNQKGTITVGSNGRQLSTKLDIGSGSC